MLVMDADGVRARLPYDRLIPSVAAAFQAHGRRLLPPPGKVDTFVPGGEFHVKTGAAAGVFAVKANSGFFGKPSGPAIQGRVTVFDLADGTPLATLESTVLTRRRTAAVTTIAIEAVALAPPSRIGLLGAGSQAVEHAKALAFWFPVEEFVIWSRTRNRAAEAASAIRDDAGISCRIAATAAEAARDVDVAVTLTPSRSPLLREPDVANLPLVVGVGADSPGKHELDARLLASRALVTDVTAQCAAAGDLQHALAAGAMTTAEVYAELGALLAGLVPRPHPPAVIDLTGTGFADAAAAAVVLDLV